MTVGCWQFVPRSQHTEYLIAIVIVAIFWAIRPCSVRNEMNHDTFVESDCPKLFFQFVSGMFLQFSSNRWFDSMIINSVLPCLPHKNGSI